jgi:hypothetical protein
MKWNQGESFLFSNAHSHEIGCNRRERGEGDETGRKAQRPQGHRGLCSFAVQPLTPLPLLFFCRATSTVASVVRTARVACPPARRRYLDLLSLSLCVPFFFFFLSSLSASLRFRSPPGIRCPPATLDDTPKAPQTPLSGRPGFHCHVEPSILSMNNTLLPIGRHWPWL